MDIIQETKNRKRVIFQRFQRKAGGRLFPYPPLCRELDTDYICFTDDVRVRSSEWEIRIVENPLHTDLDSYLKEYAVRWELQPEQIQMGELFSAACADENVITITELENLPLVRFDPEKLVPTADEKRRYIYQRNPVYRDGKYSGRPLLLTIGVPVSNQIDTIDRCLSHIKPLLDQLDAELLVVDTGSTDGTVEVCRKYGARVIVHPWCDNMSAVRNEGIYHARGEWYMSIDDDEWFEDVEDILSFFKQGIYQNYDMASYIQRNYMDSAGTDYEDYHTLRMARITPELHFEGRIHDALVLETTSRKPYALHSYAHHYGFKRDTQKNLEKFMRNASILIQDVYEYPWNLRYLFQLANEYRCIKYTEVAEKLFALTIAQAKEMNDKYYGKNSVVLLIACLYEMYDQRIFQWAENLQNMFPLTDPEHAFIAWCQQGIAHQYKMPSERVLKYYDDYIKWTEQYQKDPVRGQALTLYGLAVVEHENYIMDADAMAFCAYLSLGKEEKAMAILPRISMDMVNERHADMLKAGLAAGDQVYKAVCDKITQMQREEEQGGWQKDTEEIVKNGRKVIFQRFPFHVVGRHFPYPPLYREADTDYICFTDDTRVYSSVWEIQIVENVAQADLEPWLEQYTVRYEMQPEQIQMDSFTEGCFGKNLVAIPKLDELALVRFDPQKLIPTADEEGKYIYRKNPVYSGGKYNGRPLLLTIGVPVSNQIDTIERCLSHIEPLLKQLDAELLVVDTGSTDGTVEVCRNHGARVISYPWCDNMSAARNEGIYNARGEWYLSIDDDEWFEDVEEILSFFKEGIYRNYDQATYIQRNYADSAGTIYDDHHTLRMARITPGLHFVGRIHDALVVEPGYDRVCVLRSYAHHYGFVSDNSEKTQEKFMRNASLLLQDIYEYPEDLRYMFQLAQEYAAISQKEMTIKLFLKTIAMAKEQDSRLWGKNSVVQLVNYLYGADDQRLFSWTPIINSLFPLTAAEQAYIAWCQESLAFLTGWPAEPVLGYYRVYKDKLEEYRKDPALNQYLTCYGLAAVEKKLYIMDADAMAFCSYLKIGREEEALELLPQLSLERMPERRIAVFAAGFSAGDKVYESVCSKITPVHWEEWKEEILNAFAVGIRKDAVYKSQMGRLSGLVSRISVSAVLSWFGHAGERRGGKVEERLLEYAMECEIEKNSIQALCLCSEVLKEAYVKNRKTGRGKEIFYRYLTVLAAFAEQYYNPDLLIDLNSQVISADVRAFYRMAVVLADGKASHENIEILKQALSIFPAAHEEIRIVLTELSI